MNRDKKHIRLYRSDDNASIISSALSGTTGGALLGSSFGIIGGIVGGITGYSGYKDVHKRYSIVRKTQIMP